MSTANYEYVTSHRKCNLSAFTTMTGIAATQNNMTMPQRLNPSDQMKWNRVPAQPSNSTLDSNFHFTPKKRKKYPKQRIHQN